MSPIRIFNAKTPRTAKAAKFQSGLAWRPSDRSSRLRVKLLLSFLFLLPAQGAVPDLVHHQGRVSISGIPFDGAASFKFALVSPDASVTRWSHDGTSVAGSEPATALTLPVSRGLYALALGDTAVPGMATLPASAFAHPDVRLRVWFDDGVNGSQLLSPDQRLASAPYALHASSAGSAASLAGPLTSANIPAGLITDAMLAGVGSESPTPSTLVVRDASGAIAATSFAGDGSTLSNLSLSALRTAPSLPVLAWGSGTGGVNAPPTFAAPVAQIVGARSASLARLSTGAIVVWGDAPALAAVPAFAQPASHLAASHDHALAVTASGAVVAWGRDDRGQATAPALPAPAIRVAAGELHSLALLADGTVAAWGDDTAGQTTVPAGLSDVVAIAAGERHSLALKADGTVIAWGANELGQTDVPPGIVGVVSIAAGSFHSLALKNDGSVVAWGWNASGQCEVPVATGPLASIAAGYAHSVAATAGGAIVAWGDNSSGQLSPAAGLSDVASVSAGAYHTLALRAASVPVPLARLDRDNVFAGRVGIGRVPATFALEVEGNASKSTASGWFANSDRRIKTEIAPVSGALDLVSRVRPVTFRYTPEYLAAHPAIPDARYYNVVAQEFQTVFPEAVIESGDKLPDGSAVLQVDTYPALIAALAAIQELEARNAALEKRLEALEKRLPADESR